MNRLYSTQMDPDELEAAPRPAPAPLTPIPGRIPRTAERTRLNRPPQGVRDDSFDLGQRAEPDRRGLTSNRRCKHVKVGYG